MHVKMYEGPSRIIYIQTIIRCNERKQTRINDANFCMITSECETLCPVLKPMYKSKLQEVCQKRKWALPKYTYIKDGQDHCPQFKASVVVRGITFDSPTPSTSSKQALNQAAKLAFLHFIIPQDSNQRSEDYSEKTNSTQKYSKISEDMAEKHSEADVQEGFKRKLNIYAQRKNLGQPVYHSKKEGLCFNARVCVDDDWFQSRGLYESAEEAETSAAEAAFLSLLAHKVHASSLGIPCHVQNDCVVLRACQLYLEQKKQNDAPSYKVLLQELADNGRFFLPAYTTKRYNNESNCEIFSSMVEVNGEVFHGATAKSRMLAETSAAKAAYTVFIERMLFQPGYMSRGRPSCDDNDTIKVARRLCSTNISDPQKNKSNGTSIHG